MPSEPMTNRIPASDMVACDDCVDGVRRTRVSIDTGRGGLVAGLLVEVESTAKPLQVIIPGLGGTIREGALFARALADNGYSSLRFDYTNHVGASSGNVWDASVRSISDDILLVSEWLQSIGVERVSAIASSVSARGLLLAARGRRLSFASAVLVAPVVDLAGSVGAATGRDYFAEFREGHLAPTSAIELVGHAIAATFVGDAVRDSYDSLESSRRDLVFFDAPLAVVALERDEWVDLDTLVSLFDTSAAGASNVDVVPIGTHTTKALPVVKQIVARTVRAVGRLDGSATSDVLEDLSIRRMARWMATERTFMDTVEDEVVTNGV